jgi:hypothetical protein
VAEEVVDAIGVLSAQTMEVATERMQEIVIVLATQPALPKREWTREHVEQGGARASKWKAGGPDEGWSARPPEVPQDVSEGKHHVEVLIAIVEKRLREPS